MHAHNGSHMVVLPLLQRRWSLRGREVFGILSPSHQACEVIFNVFMEMNCLFSITPKTKLKRMRSHVDAGLDSVRCWAHVRWVQRSKTQMAMRVGASYSLASVRQILCWRSLMLTFNRQLIMEKDPIQLTPRLRVLSDRIPRVLVFVYFYRGLSGNTEKRPTRRVYIEILTCRAIFYHLEDSRSHGNEAEAERGLAQGARPPSVPNQSPFRDHAPPT